MAADDIVTQGAMALVVMALDQFVPNILGLLLYKDAILPVQGFPL